MRIVSRTAADASSAYDSYYSFYYTAPGVTVGARDVAGFLIRDDHRIWLEDEAGEILDIICNGAGEIASIAFRQEISQPPAGASLPPLPAAGGAEIAVIDDPEQEQHRVRRVAASFIAAPDGGEAVLVSVAEDRITSWRPISKSAFVGLDEGLNVAAFLFTDTVRTAD